MATVSESYEAALLRRLLAPQEGCFSAETVKDILKLRLDADDERRLHELIVRNQAGELSDEEAAELEAFRRVGYFVDLIRAKAMASVKQDGDAP